MNLNFFPGDRLPDPHKVLKGSGKLNRYVRLEGAATLDEPAVQALTKAAVQNASQPLDRRQKGRIVIASVAAKRRPRRVGKSG